MYFFFFNDTATTEIYTLSLHDALPIFIENANSDTAFHFEISADILRDEQFQLLKKAREGLFQFEVGVQRSEEHTSELQSRQYLVCRLLLEKKNNSRRCFQRCRFCLT